MSVAGARGGSGAARLRLGIAGTGFIGQMHARNAARSNEIELVAVASARSAATAAGLTDELGGAVRAVTITQLLDADDVDAILLATRTTEHADHAVEVIRSGKHLLLEKPGATTLVDHRRIADEAGRHPDQVVRVAYHRRHDPRFRELERLIESGAIGEPFAVHSLSRENYPPDDGDAYSGGFIMDVGVHDFDTARWLLRAEPETVYARGQNAVYDEGGPDNVQVTISAQRATTTVQLSRTSRVGLEIRFEVVGTDGAALLSPAAHDPGITLLTKDRTHAFPVDCRGAFADAYPQELADFAAACHGDTAPGATLADDRWAVATAIAARASAARAEPLSVGEDYA